PALICTRLPYTTLFRSEALTGAVDLDIYLCPTFIAAFGFQEPCGERRHPNPLLQAGPQIQKRAIMVFMRVGDDDANDIVELALRSEEHTSELQSRENLV